MRNGLGQFLKGDKRPHISERNRSLVGANALHWKGGKNSHSCPTCKQEFFAWKSDNKKYCSRNCAYSSTERSLKISKKATGRASLLKGVPRTQETKEKISTFHKSKHHSPETEFKLGKKRPDITGSNHPRWKEDRTQLAQNELKHLCARYKEWMKKVKERDGWACRIADNNCNGKMEAHHILRWSQFPELRYEVNNGITLCHFHHPRKINDEVRLIPTFMELVKVNQFV